MKVLQKRKLLICLIVYILWILVNNQNLICFQTLCLISLLYMYIMCIYVFFFIVQSSCCSFRTFNSSVNWIVVVPARMEQLRFGIWRLQSVRTRSNPWGERQGWTSPSTACIPSPDRPSSSSCVTGPTPLSSWTCKDRWDCYMRLMEGIFYPLIPDIVF